MRQSAIIIKMPCNIMYHCNTCLFKSCPSNMNVTSSSVWLANSTKPLHCCYGYPPSAYVATPPDESWPPPVLSPLSTHHRDHKFPLRPSRGIRVNIRIGHHIGWDLDRGYWTTCCIKPQGKGGPNVIGCIATAIGSNQDEGG